MMKPETCRLDTVPIFLSLQASVDLTPLDLQCGRIWPCHGFFLKKWVFFGVDNEGDDHLLEESSVHAGWKGGSSHGTETGEFIELETMSHPQEAVDVASPDVKGDSLNTGSKCKWCGQLVEQSEQAQQEHEDYHFALSLQEDSRGSNSMEVVTGKSSYGTPKSREKPRTYISPTSKRPKSRNGTLDGFLLRR